MSMLLAMAYYMIAAALLVFPAVVTIFAMRHGPLAGLLLIAGPSALLLATGGLDAGLIIALGFGGLGLALWHYGKRPIRLELYFATLVSIFLLGTVGVHYLVSALAGYGPIDASYLLLDQIRASYDAYIDLMATNTGGEQLAKLNDLRAAKAIWVWGFFKLMPSFLVLGAAALVLINILLVRHLLPALLGLQLNRWRTPDTAIWVLLIPGLGLLPYLLLRLRGVGDQTVMLFYFSLNLVIIALIPYLLQGLAVMSFFLKRWRLPRLLRGLTFFLVLSQGLVAAVAALGLMEFWTDLRGRAIAPKPKKDKNELDE